VRKTLLWRGHRRTVAALAAATLALTTAGAAPALARDHGSGSDSRKLQKAVTLKGVERHLTALQSIADDNKGTRASGTPGFKASVDYVVGQLRRAGYRPAVQEFDFPFFEETAPSTFALTSPATNYVNGTDFATMEFSGSGSPTASVVPVDVRIPPGPTPSGNTSGCEPADFTGFPTGAVALVQRGTCTFGQKAANAQAAGASAVVIFNEGQPGRDGLLEGTLGQVVGIPAIGTTFAVGEDLYNRSQAAGGATVRVTTSTFSETRQTYNVIAQTKRGRTDNVVMAGAHLDSVLAGPGINDNGSGSAAILEIARQLAKESIKTNNAVRFAWWGAEESGLLGSAHYVESLPVAEREKIAAYLNFDMIASPNYFLGIYDGDGDAFGTAGPAGSGALEAIFEKYFADKGLPSEGTEFSGRSDYAAFIENDIPAGGLFTGAEEIKTAEQAAKYGGTAGTAFDVCYHQACDTIGNVNEEALDINSDAIADAIASLARDTSAVNGVTSGGKGHGGDDRDDRDDPDEHDNKGHLKAG
jgi:Zn-dependent M28 family amino/carboxypeptidase